jgi:beta-lactamase regulating signal transducer with metallopeptidase domain
MTGALTLDNLVPWLVQVSAVSLLGTLLPMIFIRHARTRLAFGYVALIVCLLLPFVQPRVVSRARQSPDVKRSAGALNTPAPTTKSPRVAAAVVTDEANHQVGEDVARAATHADARASESSAASSWHVNASVAQWLAWVIGAGALFGLARLVIAAWHIRRLRIAATPLFPVPQSVEDAAALVGAHGLVCLSPSTASPAALGVFRPVVLMPASFLDLDVAAQRAVACHEFLHVRRRDWLLAFVERVIAAAMWCSPIAWLISEIRLAREQVVDAEVVRLTDSRDVYIRALLDIARGRPMFDGVPVPMFLRRRHLTHRVHALLEEASTSFGRLSLGCAVTTMALLAGTVVAVGAFPLVITVKPSEAALVRRVAAPAPIAEVIQQPQEARVDAPKQAVARRATVPEPAAWDEPVTGSIAEASTPDARAATLAILERAKQNSDLHIAGTPPFQLDASFDASGAVNDVGSGVVSETWMSGQRWRWSAALGSYSQVRIGSGQRGWDDAAVQSVPTRVHMLRSAIFWPVRVPPQIRLRTSTARVDSATVTCVLLAPYGVTPSDSRAWNEEEYCVDGQGRLRVYSAARGVYTHFVYTRPLQFGGRTLPESIETFVGGQSVLQARLAIADAGMPDEALFTPSAAMVAAGIGLPLSAGVRFRIPGTSDTSVAGESIAVVHAEIGADGRVLDAEVADADPRVASAVLDLVKRHRFPANGVQRDAYVGVDTAAAGLTQ